MDERAFYTESQATKPATLNCPYCRSAETYDLHWMVRKIALYLTAGLLLFFVLYCRM